MNNGKLIRKDYISAGSPKATGATLHCLSQSKVAAVRRRVAENAIAPVNILARLARDQDPQVRMAVGLNPATPYAVTSQLVYDEDPDVRYWLASASYLPKRLLVELASDSNPYIARRAELTATMVQAGLPSRKLNVFEFLGQDHSLLVARLEKLIAHHSHCREPHIFDETIDAIECLRTHFGRQHKFCLSEIVRKDWLSPELLSKTAKDHKHIDEKINDLILIHIGGAQDLTRDLQQLLDLVLSHIEFAEEELFVELRQKLSQEKLDEMSVRVNEPVLSRTM